jgi:hypothetical protein
MEPGSGGSHVAREVANQLGFDYFHRDIIEGIAKSAKNHPQDFFSQPDFCTSPRLSYLH